MQGLNVVRVISLFYLGQWNMQVFNFAHEDLWQALIMLDVLVAWLLWVRAAPVRALLRHPQLQRPDARALPCGSALPLPSSCCRPSAG